nr:DUF3857 domain-containing protein [Aminobacter aminovorans]
MDFGSSCGRRPARGLGRQDAATINLNFDPARHSIKLNHLRVIRDGVVQDRLAEATFDIYRQERDSGRGVFDGWLTARLDVRDVRVGDTIDYATTSDRKQLVGEDLFYYRNIMTSNILVFAAWRR